MRGRSPRRPWRYIMAMGAIESALERVARSIEGSLPVAYPLAVAHRDDGSGDDTEGSRAPGPQIKKMDRLAAKERRPCLSGLLSREGRCAIGRAGERGARHWLFRARVVARLRCQQQIRTLERAPGVCRAGVQTFALEVRRRRSREEEARVKVQPSS